MTLVDTLLVNGVDVQSLAGITVTRLDLFAPGLRRGSDDVVPGRRGQVGAALVYDAYAFSVEILVSGSTHAEMVANLAAVGAALATSTGLVTLTRRLSTSGGHVDHTASGRYVGITAVELLNTESAQTELQFVQLDGAWNTGTAWLVP